MSTKNDGGSSPPPLPAPTAQQAIWHDNGQEGSWLQWHDADDPLPTEWDEPPDAVRDYFTADQMLAYGQACAAAERETIVQLIERANVRGSGMFREDLIARIRARGKI